MVGIYHAECPQLFKTEVLECSVLATLCWLLSTYLSLISIQQCEQEQRLSPLVGHGLPLLSITCCDGGAGPSRSVCVNGCR